MRCATDFHKRFTRMLKRCHLTPDQLYASVDLQALGTGFSPTEILSGLVSAGSAAWGYAVLAPFTNEFWVYNTIKQGSRPAAYASKNQYIERPSVVQSLDDFFTPGLYYLLWGR